MTGLRGPTAPPGGQPRGGHPRTRGRSARSVWPEERSARSSRRCSSRGTGPPRDLERPQGPAARHASVRPRRRRRAGRLARRNQIRRRMQSKDLGRHGAWLKSKSLLRSPEQRHCSRARRGAGRDGRRSAGSSRCAAQEVVLDELHVGVEAERLVVDEALPRVRADDHAPARAGRSRSRPPAAARRGRRSRPSRPRPGRSRCCSSPGCA